MRVRVLSTLLVAGALAATPVTVHAAGAATTVHPRDWSTASRVVSRSPAVAPAVTGIRVGHHRRFDRVVVDLSGPAAGFSVRYVRKLRADASGKVLRLRGPATLRVTLSPANAHDINTGASTLTTPQRTNWLLDQVRATRVAGDNEAVFTLGVGLAHTSPFRVFTLHQPTRIVIDIRH